MSTQNDSSTPNKYKGKERRTNVNLREYFDVACQITAPLFENKPGLDGNPSTLYAHLTLREKFPDLPPQDIAMLFSAVRAFYKTRRGK